MPASRRKRRSERERSIATHDPTATTRRCAVSRAAVTRGARRAGFVLAVTVVWLLRAREAFG